MGEPVHYLKLAYLAETAIVFNLAYIELKWKQDFKKLADNTDQIANLSAPERKVTTPKICKKRECSKCNSREHIKNRFGRFNLEYLSEIQNAVRSDTSGVANNTLNEIWLHSDCWGVTQTVLKYFHRAANREFDKYISSWLLIIASAVLIVITTIDNNMDIFGLFTWFGLWNSERWWSSLFSYLLLFSLSMPGMLWLMWHKFLGEYECLGARLVKAYQEMSREEVSDSVNDFSN